MDLVVSLISLKFLDGNYKVAEVLLKHKAEVNAQDQAGWTPIHYSVYRGKFIDIFA